MVKYYIGLHDEFDKRKYEKDFTDHISGIELCNFKSTDEVDEIYALSLSEAFDLGVHFPLFQSSYKYRDPLVTSHDSGEVEAAFDAIENELVYSRNINAKYLLIHFPKPMLIDNRMDFSLVSYQAHDAIASEAYTEESFVLACKQALIRLNALSLKHEIPIVLELEFMNNWFYCGDWFVEALDQNKALSVCLDMARIHLQNHMDPGFDQYEFVRKLSKYTRVLHVANLQIRESDTVRHHPAFPELHEENGWANIEKLLSCLDDRSRLQSVLFEHRTEGVDREKVITCYEWVRSLFMDNNVMFTKVDPHLHENESLLQQIAIWHNTTPKQWLVDYRITPDDISETIQSLVKAEGLSLFLEVAKDAYENAIGFVWAYRDKEGEKRVIIKSLYVDPAYRKHGIASQLKEHLELWCKREGVCKIETTVHYTNKKMIALNEKLGYSAGMVTMTKKL